jgi:hypothetical protein
MSDKAIQLPEEKVDALRGIVGNINQLVSMVGDLALQVDDATSRLSSTKAQVLELANQRQEILNELEEEFGKGVINLEEGTLVQE